MFSDIQYDFPAAFYLLALIPVIIAFYIKLSAYRSSVIKQWGDKALVDSITKQASKTRRTLIVVLICLSWMLATISLASPKGNPHYVRESTVSEPLTALEISKKTRPHNIVFLIDASLSMTVSDTRKGISRFEEAKEIIDSTVNKLQGETVAVYAFTSNLVPVVPETNDYLFARLMLQNISINEGQSAGTDLLTIFQRLKNHYAANPIAKKTTVVILSDGDDTQLLDGNKGVRDRIKKEIKSIADELKNANVEFYTIGVGSEKGGPIPNYEYEGKKVFSKLDPDLLKGITKKGSGKYISAFEDTPFGLATEILSRIREADVEEEVEDLRLQPAMLNAYDPLTYDYYFQVPLAFAMLSLILAMTLPERRSA